MGGGVGVVIRSLTRINFVVLAGEHNSVRVERVPCQVTTQGSLSDHPGWHLKDSLKDDRLKMPPSDYEARHSSIIDDISLQQIGYTDHEVPRDKL